MAKSPNWETSSNAEGQWDVCEEHAGDMIALLMSETPQEHAELIVRAANSHAALVEALAKVRQELWIDYCLQAGTSEPNGDHFDSRPHIRIIDAALTLAKGA